MIKTILFATDFSSITERAQEYAIGIAKAMGAKLTLLHSVEPIEDANEQVRGFLESKQTEARDKAEAVVKRLEEQGIESEICVELGKRWKVIVDKASKGEYDLVVLGSHKVRDGDKIYLGTTTHKVFFAIDVPLLVVPS